MMVPSRSRNTAGLTISRLGSADQLRVPTAPQTRSGGDPGHAAVIDRALAQHARPAPHVAGEYRMTAAARRRPGAAARCARSSVGPKTAITGSADRRRQVHRARVVRDERARTPPARRRAPSRSVSPDDGPRACGSPRAISSRRGSRSAPRTPTSTETTSRRSCSSARQAAEALRRPLLRRPVGGAWRDADQHVPRPTPCRARSSDALGAMRLARHDARGAAGRSAHAEASDERLVVVGLVQAPARPADGAREQPPRRSVA